jgi:hypothetical protein
VQRSLLKFRLHGLLFVAAWGALAWRQASLGHTLVATFVALPVIAVIFTLISPHAGPGHYAFTEELGEAVDPSLTSRQQEIQEGLGWLIGSCLLPMGALLAYLTGLTGWFEEGHAIYIFFGGLLPLMGIACFLKAVGAFVRAWRAR